MRTALTSLSTLIFLTVALIFSGQTAFALGFAEKLILQSTLNSHGYDVGKPDGKFGPATRRGIAAFSKDYGSSTDPDALFLFMYKLHLQNRVKIEDPEFLEIIKNGVSKLMRDPESTQIRNVYSIIGVRSEFICGEVNGKNAYGGYAGFTHFYGMALSGNFVTIGIDSDDPVARIICELSFPFGQFN